MAKPDNKDIIASAVKVNIEKVISLKPDLVVATSITSPEVIEIFRKFNIRTEVFPTPCSFHEICQQFKRLADLMGKPLLASNIIEESKAKVDSIHKNCKIAYNPKVFMQIGAKPLFTVIPNTFMDDYIHYIKGTNIASDFTRGSITRESVIARNPDIIIIVTMGIVGYEEKEIWEAYSNLSASKNNKIFIIDSNIACTPSPYAFVEALELINNQLN
jgi:iron complex transport system substrate-binding protein